MRKVYMSFLGTNNYLPCNYVYQPHKKSHIPVKNVRFVQEASVIWHCSDWEKDDRILIFATREAHDSNWVDNGHRRPDNTIISVEGLEKRLANLNLLPGIREISIPAGKSEAEIWEIFTAVVEKLEDNDELYLDITHAFRSLPLLATVIINYAKVIKTIQVKAINYGAMEALGSLRDVQALAIEERDVPVFDLLPFDQLLDWSIAIDRFVVAGDAAAIHSLTSQKVIARKQEIRGPDDDADNMKKMAKALEIFSNTMAACRGKSISTDAQKLKESICRVTQQQLIKPMTPLLEKLEKTVNEFSGDEVLDGIAAAEWCRQHNLVQQGFTILQETAITHILIQSINADSTDIDKRNLVGKAVKITLNNIPEDRWDRKARNQKVLIDQICEWLAPQKTLLDCIRNMGQSRNDLNHAGMNPNPMAGDKFKTKLQEYIKALSSCCR